MNYRSLPSQVRVSAGLRVAPFALLMLVVLGGAKQRPQEKTDSAPPAKQVELFAAESEGLLELRYIPRSALAGKVSITNKSDQPLTVQLPRGIVGIHILKQAPGGNIFGNPNGGNAQGQNAGGGQPVGIGLNGQNANGPGGQNGLNNLLNANGLFSIPPERTIRFSVPSVCLAHGRPDPRSRMTYKLVPLESKVSHPVLREIVESMGNEQADPQVLQAAAWHFSDNLSWQDLQAKQIRRLGWPSAAYFTPAQLQAANKLVQTASERVDSRKKKSDKSLTATQARR